MAKQLPESRKDQITNVLNHIEGHWRMHPELTLGQLLNKIENDPYNLTDDDLLDELCQVYRRRG